MARVHPPHFWEKWMRRFVRSEMMMKAVWKKLIAVAFCGATAASMLSVGASAAWYNDNLIEYGMFAESKTYQLEDHDGNYYGDVYFYLTAQNWQEGKVEAHVSVPKDAKVTNYEWTGSNIKTGSSSTMDSTTIDKNAKTFSATCKITVEYKDEYWYHGSWISSTTTRTFSLTIKSNKVYSSAYDAENNWNETVSSGYYDPDRGYWYDGKWYDSDYGYWYNGKWYWYDYDYNRPSRPSYSKEYEVDWDTDTFYYNGKVQMPTATVTIGGRTIELDVKLISGDGTSVGRHRVRASLPSRYSRYDITGTTLYYEIEEPEKDGFVTENGNTYYYDNGRKVTGWQTINGSRYYFLDNGEAADGWVKDGPADWYYFSDGKMQTGWINDNGTTYYCYGTGKMCHGRWHEIAGKWYYFNESGAMLTSQWILDKGNWYYVAGDGVMATNTTVPGGYRVNASGVWVK